MFSYRGYMLTGLCMVFLGFFVFFVGFCVGNFIGKKGGCFAYFADLLADLIYYCSMKRTQFRMFYSKCFPSTADPPKSEFLVEYDEPVIFKYVADDNSSHAYVEHATNYDIPDKLNTMTTITTFKDADIKGYCVKTPSHFVDDKTPIKEYSFMSCDLSVIYNDATCNYDLDFFNKDCFFAFVDTIIDIDFLNIYLAMSSPSSKPTIQQHFKYTLTIVDQDCNIVTVTEKDQLILRESGYELVQKPSNDVIDEQHID